MLIEALRIGLEVVKKNHVYKFNGLIHHQQKGRAIGLEITGNVAQVFMIWWDRMFTSRLSEFGIIERLCKRYVDDINMAIDKLPAGTRYADGRLFINEMAIKGDLLVAKDKRKMEVIKRVGNSIHTSIQLEVDCPSNHDDGKMPFLDLKLYLIDVGVTKKIVHEFYVKAVSTKAMVNADSALAMRQKRTVLTHEVLRVLLNCSIYIPWEEIAQYGSSMVLQMQLSGFSKKFRFEIVTSALKVYDEIHRKVEGGERPLYRRYEWDSEERDQAKINKDLDWYKKRGYESVIFVQSTPRAELRRKLQTEIFKSDVRI
eukprot:gene15094-16650_t